MSRVTYSEDEDYPGQFELWQANLRRSMHGKAGQAALTELRGSSGWPSPDGYRWTCHEHWAAAHTGPTTAQDGP